MSIATYPARELASAASFMGQHILDALTATFTAETTVCTTQVYVPPGGRRVKVIGSASVDSSVANDIATVRIKEDGAEKQRMQFGLPLQGAAFSQEKSVVLTPSPGVHTYTMTVARGAGTGNLRAYATNTYLLVEDISGGAGGTGPQLLVYKTNAGAAPSPIGQTRTLLPGLSAAVNVPAGRALRIKGWIFVANPTDLARSALYIHEGATQLQGGFVLHPGTGANTTVQAEVVVFPSAGPHTYDLQGLASLGTSTYAGDGGTHPNYIMVEDITGTPAPGVIDDTGWIVPTLLNGWVDFGGGYQTAAYRKRQGMVLVKGLIKNGTTTAGTDLLILPTGFRPAERMILGGRTGTPTEQHARLDVTSLGEVKAYSGAGATFLSLSDIQFLAEQ